MGWGTYYKYEGYLSRISKSQLESKREECSDTNDMLWREILAYMASTPPATTKDCEGEEYPFAEFIANRVAQIREEIEENDNLITRIDECLDVMRENPESVTES